MRHHTTTIRTRASRHLTVLALCLAGLLTAAATSAAATMTFSGSFEAERSAHWDQPRGVNLIDCRGQHYLAANGEDKATIKTRRPFKVTVKQIGRNVFWQFGDPLNPRDPLAYGVEAHGVSTRSYTHISGATGGWCGSAETDPQPKNDCGTRLPVYQVVFSGSPREVTWSASFAHRENERFDFYDCPLIVPSGMYEGSFPDLPGKVNRAALFNRSRRTLVIGASKPYGPDSTGVPNFGVTRTASGKVSWKLTLTRVR